MGKWEVDIDMEGDWAQRKNGKKGNMCLLYAFTEDIAAKSLGHVVLHLCTMPPAASEAADRQTSHF